MPEIDTELWILVHGGAVAAAEALGGEEISLPEGTESEVACALLDELIPAWRADVLGGGRRERRAIDRLAGMKALPHDAALRILARGPSSARWVVVERPDAPQDKVAEEWEWSRAAIAEGDDPETYRAALSMAEAVMANPHIPEDMRVEGAVLVPQDASEVRYLAYDGLSVAGFQRVAEDLAGKGWPWYATLNLIEADSDTPLEVLRWVAANLPPVPSMRKNLRAEAYKRIARREGRQDV